MNPGDKYQSVHNPNTVVEIVCPIAEFRIGEVRQPCIIYTKRQRFYVRTEAEFLAKFRPIQSGQ